MAGVIYKPYSVGGLNGGGASFLIGNGSYQSASIYDANGNKIHDLARSPTQENGVTKFYSRSPGSAFGNGFSIGVTDSSGKLVKYPIQQGGQGYAFDPGNPDSGRIYNHGGGSFAGGGLGGGPFGGILGAGGGSAGLGALPFNLSGAFPQFQPVNFQPVNFQPVSFPTIQQAPYNFTDVQKFGKDFADFQRGELGQNFDQSQQFALSALNTELKGLQGYAPGAAALSRGLTSQDINFNQSNRTAQVNAALPGVQGALNAQGQRAATYASGNLPDAQQNYALELGIRSGAADRATFSGFGASSGEAGKISDLLSAEQRFNIAQYGEGQVNSNIAQKAGLFLAPTEYSQLGTQIRPTPEVGAGQLTYQGYGAANAASLVSPGQALSTTVQQEQFKTDLAQRTNEFNASGMFNASTFNSSNALQAGEFNSSSDLGAQEFNSQGQFAAGLGMFNYQVGLGSQIQATNQANITGAFNVGQQGINNGTAQNFANAGQNAATIQSTTGALGAIPGALNTASQIFGGTQSPSPTPVQAQSAPSAAPSVENTSSAAQQPLAATQPNIAPLNDTTTNGGSGYQIAPGAMSFDGASPSAVRFAQGVPAANGYVPFAQNNDGTYSAANTKDYNSELEQFSRASGTEQGAVKVQNAAIADRNVSNAAAVSYVPVPGFKPIALSTSGKTVYSLPAAAASGNIQAGRDNIVNVGLMSAALGVTDKPSFDQLGRVAAAASDPVFHNTLDRLSDEKGSTAVTRAIVNKVLGRSPDLKTDAGQQLSFMAHRIGQLWPNLSPQQKSMALASLSGASVKSATGKDLQDHIVPGTEASPAGALRAGDAAALTLQGTNGMALARNWNQLSSISHMAVGTKGVNQIAQVSDHTGLLGFGPQGSAVPASGHDLADKGAIPAPELGVGAVTLPGWGALPAHYSVVSKTPDGRRIALPTNLAHTTPLGTGTPSALAYQKATQVAEGKHPVQKNWSKASPAGAVTRGSVGGSSIVSGMHIMTKANPALFSAIAAHSLYNEMLGSDNG